MPLPITTTSAFALLRRGSAAATSVPAHSDLLFSFSTFIVSTAYSIAESFAPFALGALRSYFGVPLQLPTRSCVPTRRFDDRVADGSRGANPSCGGAYRINGMLMRPRIAGFPRPSSIVDAYLGRSLPPLERLARHVLGRQLVEIFLPVARVVAAEIAQIVPTEYAGRVHVVEHQPHGVIADRQHLENGDVALAGHHLALFRRMALHFRARALHAQVFGGKLMPLAAAEADGQRLAVLVQAQFARPGVLIFRHGGVLTCASSNHKSHRAGPVEIVAAQLLRARGERVRAHKAGKRLHRRLEIVALAQQEIKPLPHDRHESEPGGGGDRARGDAGVGAAGADRLCDVGTGRAYRPGGEIV